MASWLVRRAIRSATYPPKRWLWLHRFRKRQWAGQADIGISSQADARMRGLDRCEIRFINLASRPDRRESVEAQFSKLNISSFERFDAIAEVNGPLGCARSHVAVLETPAAHGKVLMICEDDIVFESDRHEIDPLIDEFLDNPSLDVLCLAFNLATRPHWVSPFLGITDDTQTTALYLCKERARIPIREVFLDSVADLARGRSGSRAAIDQKWKRLQRGRLFFSVPRVRVARQSAGYSDIEKRFTDYGV